MKTPIAKLLGSLLAILLFSATVRAEPVWIDVRSDAENSADSIAGDAHIEYTEIGQQITALVSNKNTEIVLYCAVGGRSGKAKKTLDALGYTNVRNGGGIEDVRHERGLTN